MGWSHADNSSWSKISWTSGRAECGRKYFVGEMSWLSSWTKGNLLEDNAPQPIFFKLRRTHRFLLMKRSRRWLAKISHGRQSHGYLGSKKVNESFSWGAGNLVDLALAYRSGQTFSLVHDTILATSAKHLSVFFLFFSPFLKHSRKPKNLIFEIRIDLYRVST